MATFKSKILWVVEKLILYNKTPSFNELHFFFFEIVSVKGENVGNKHFLLFQQYF